MNTNYELKTKICEKTGNEVVSAIEKTDAGEKEYCLCSHLCKEPCSMFPKTFMPDLY